MIRWRNECSVDTHWKCQRGTDILRIKVAGEFLLTLYNDRNWIPRSFFYSNSLLTRAVLVETSPLLFFSQLQNERCCIRKRSYSMIIKVVFMLRCSRVTVSTITIGTNFAFILAGVLLLLDAIKQTQFRSIWENIFNKFERREYCLLATCYCILNDVLDDRTSTL